MSSASLRDRLRQAEFLEGLTDSALHQLAKLVSVVTFECDEVLFEEGGAAQVHGDHRVGSDRGREGTQRPPDPSRHARRRPGARRGAAARRVAARHERARRAAHRGVRRHGRPGARDVEGVSGALRRARRRAPRARSRSDSPRPTRRSSATAARSASPARARDASTTCSASATCPRTRSTACRRCARSRISRSPASRCANSPCSSRRSRR